MLRAKLRAMLRAMLRAKLRAKLGAKLRAKLRAKSRAKLRARLRAKVACEGCVRNMEPLHFSTFLIFSKTGRCGRFFDLFGHIIAEKIAEAICKRMVTI